MQVALITCLPHWQWRLRVIHGGSPASHGHGQWPALTFPLWLVSRFASGRDGAGLVCDEVDVMAVFSEIRLRG